MKQNVPFVITISRQLGSGASYIGQQLARKLSVCYADREIIRKAAEKLSVLETDLEARDESVPSFWRSLMQTCGLVPDVYVPPKMLIPTDRELFDAESEVIEHMAKEGSMIIIGRCGSYVLRNHPNHVSVFLHGDPVFRSERYRNVYQVTKEEADRMVALKDKERALYNKTFTGKDWTDARNFDLSIDTSKLRDLDAAVDLILHYLKMKQQALT